MQRGNTRQPSPGGFRSPTADNNNNNGGGGRFSSPSWGYRGGRSPSAMGPRFGNFSGGGGGSPNYPRDFGNDSNRSFGPNEGYYGNTPSPMRTPHRQDGGSGGRGPPSGGHRGPYRTPRGASQYRRGFQGSPQTSTPFVRERGGGGGGAVEKYYSPSMVQDPWASLKPVEVTHREAQCSTPNALHTGRPARYF
ncbi:hypothetical protein NHX12_004626 [Muraenolepis orangiensis]|uniref:M-phase-specific PLK1-interacting protein n=1 Tax=Muraenolepis orangiensis TaxID=630683 RepID=A0A9Q0DZE5_9TELE|nr:hypothetical protein NHX12_004626 [Muraenolepis orangiensis]